MSQASEADLDYVRAYINRWTERTGWSLRRLARDAEVDPGVLSRFLMGKSIEAGTTIRLYQCLSAGMTGDERERFLQSAKLRAFVALAVQHPLEADSSRLPPQAVGRVAALHCSGPADQPATGREAADEVGQKDWAFVRNLVGAWMRTKGISLRQLARQIGKRASSLARLNSGHEVEADTALALYGAIASDISPICRRDFLKAVGQLSFVCLLQEQFGPLTIPATPTLSHMETTQRLRAIFAHARDAASRSWQAGLASLQAAEPLLQADPPLAVHAARLVAQSHINLGNYNQAGSEIARIENDYRGRLDYESLADLWRMKGWLAYYLGHFAEAEQNFLRDLQQSKESGSIGLEIDAHHFLGRLYTAWSQSVPPIRAAQMHRRAQYELIRAQEIRRKAGLGGVSPFDLLRQAQLREAMGKGQSVDVDELLARSASEFGDDAGILHVRLEWAKVAAWNGDFRRSVLLARTGLEGWSQFAYAKGMAQALRIQAEVAAAQGKIASSLERYAAAWCMFPVSESLDNRFLRRDVETLLLDLRGELSPSNYRKEIERLREAAAARTGAFAYIDKLSADRAAAAASALHLLPGL